ncbi:MAG: DUF4876 domain-containing protein [Bacteroidaceae bacterium]|nr:DUF4876 domain-containing protein [Bacteroidaceae bacterium]
MIQTFSSWSALFLAALTVASCQKNEVVPDSHQTVDHLLITEVASSGTWHESWGREYDYDDYLRITNPSPTTQYLDGLALAKTGLVATKIVNLPAGSDFRTTHFGAGVLLRFPGSVGGTSYPIAPGASIIIARAAVDHTAKPTEKSGFWLWNPGSYDLSKANFEWASAAQLQNQNDFPDNPGVPNMTTIFPVQAHRRTNPERILPTEGALALVRIPAEVTDSMLLKMADYKWPLNETTAARAGGALESGGGHLTDYDYNPVVLIKIPNAWVIDAVQICPQRDRVWNLIEGLDKGSASVFTSAIDRKRNLRSYVGKALSRKHDGRKYVDTNNSEVDFEVLPVSLTKQR